MILSTPKVTIEQLHHWRSLFKLLIAFRHNGFIFIIKPVAFSMINLIHSLCIQLSVVNGTSRINSIGYFYTDETAAAGRVSQQILLIAGSYKRGITPKFLYRITIRFAKIHHRFLKNMLQKSLLCQRHLIKFINIDQRKAIQIHLCIPLTAKVDTISVITAKFRRYQIPAEGRLTCALRTYQEWRCTVRMLFVLFSLTHNTTISCFNINLQ